MTGAIVLDGTTDVPWAVRDGRTYTLTQNVTLAALIIEEGVFLGGEFALTCNSLVNRGTINGHISEAGHLVNEGHIDPEAMPAEPS